jgi:hypothetical protein
MTRSFRNLNRTGVTLLLCAALLGVGGSTAFAVTKPAGDFVASGAKVLYWTHPLPVSSKILHGTISVTKASVIAEVRTLINSLPLTTTGHRICPDDMMLPSTISFAVSRKTTPFAKVVFQLGGCPYARVYQHGVAMSPTLGGPHLAQVYGEIQHLINPKGVPIA